MSKKFNSIVDVRSQTLACITSRKFLEGRGLASQLPIFIASHDPMETKESESLPGWLVEQALLAGIKVLAINVFSELVLSLSEQGILQSVIEQESSRVLSRKQNTIAIQSAADFSVRFPAKFQPQIENDRPEVLIFSGFEATYPYLRVTEFVGILEEMQLEVPAVILFPGSFDNTLHSPILKLFGEIDESHNYRALDLFNYEA